MKMDVGEGCFLQPGAEGNPDRAVECVPDPHPLCWVVGIMNELLPGELGNLWAQEFWKVSELGAGIKSKPAPQSLL